jgi:NRAMP (natural resistance-associated macrophage protein)-like metal ion transporter
LTGIRFGNGIGTVATVRSRPKDSDSSWKRYAEALGPGLVTGASDDDPSGIATYAQAGARYGFGLLWLTVLSFPMMSAVQEICDRTALATGRNLGELVRDRFGRVARIIVGILLVALIAANALNVAADLVAIGAGMNLLGAGSAKVWAPLAGVAITAIVVAGSFEMVARVFKVLCAFLLTYIAVLFFVHANWGDALTHLVVPHVQLTRGYLALVVAVLGTTISPYLFFWQSAHRVEELRGEDRGGPEAVPITRLSRRKERRKERETRLDVFSGMAVSQLVMFAVIVATAATLNANGTTNVSSAAAAAQALEPIAGSASKALFAIGFVGAGVLAVPVLAGSASSGLAGLIGSAWGFSRSLRRAPVFYGLFALGTIGGALLTLLNVDPISLLVVVAVVNGVAAAPFLIVVMLVSGNRELMGDLRNGRVATVLGWGTVVIMGAAALALVLAGGG